MASTSGSPQMHRSISMPVQPQPLQTKTMKRSQEKETLYEEDYYPESPGCERRRKSRVDDQRDRLGCHSLSDNNIISAADWAGSTIELNTDLRRNEIDTFYSRRKPCRVIEKNGQENVIFKRIPEKSWRYIRDFVTTLVRFLVPKRYLMNSKSSESTTNITTVNNANHNNESSLPTETKEEIKHDCRMLEEEIVNKKGITDDNHNVRDERHHRDHRRVKFSLYD